MEENLNNNVKYIVYVTINKVNKKIYIGVHKTETDRFDGYLGDGVKISKPSSYKNSKTLFHRAVNKYGVNAFIRFTLFSFNTAKEAGEKYNLSPSNPGCTIRDCCRHRRNTSGKDEKTG